MAMNVTPFQSTDEFTMAGFNGKISDINSGVDNEITSALSGFARIETGSYVGTGTYGTFNKSSLAFDHRPLLVILFGYYTQIFSGMIPSGFGAKAPPFEDGGNQYCSYSWNGNVLSWNTNDSGPEGQNNTNGTTYYYMAIG